MQAVDTLITNVHIASMDSKHLTPYGAIPDAALAIKGGQIAWLGKADQTGEIKADNIVDGNGQWLLPGLIDCHTHMVYGGNRAREFEWRLEGESYQAIAKKGGGIVSTVAATRNESEDSLTESALKRLDCLLAEGVTTVEIKSGYALDLANEIKMLKVAGRLAELRSFSLSRTFLGAHALPPEFADDSEGYINFVCENLLPEIAQQGLCDAVDVFCEGIGFSVAQCRRVFETSRQCQLPVKGHVEQLSDLKGARLVAEFNGLSADHIEYLAPEDISCLKEADLVAVLLPGAFYCLNEKQKPPIEALRQQGVAMAVATDLNPGTSPMASLLLALNQSCVLFGLTPEEALTGATRHAAKALGMSASKGQLAIGYDADLGLWDIQHPSEICYGINMHKPTAVWHQGEERPR